MHGTSPPPSASKSLLHFFIGGAVDDGKSTLIGRLMHETGAIREDQLAALARQSQQGTTSGELDLALLVDGLEDERQQAITIDVAHCYFASPRRTFIVADTPGHEAYTRNTATGASTSELAVIVVDARKGLLSQTRRHTAIARMVGVRHLVLAVNKLDRVDWDRAVYESIAAEFRSFAQQLNPASLVTIPLSARNGDNVARRSAHTPWYGGPTLLSYLETVEIDSDRTQRPLRLPVQSVLRPDSDTRLYAGTVTGGTLRRGDFVQVAISGGTSTVERILVAGEEREQAVAGDAVAVGLSDYLDIARGDIIAHPQHRPQVAEQFEAHLVWMGEQPLLPGREYLLKMATREIGASVVGVKHRINVDTLHHDAVRTLELNEIGVCDIATKLPIAVDTFSEQSSTGCFILTDRFSNATIAAGTVDFALRRGINIHAQPLAVSKGVRASLKAQAPCILWFTGLSGAGKSTIANLVEGKLAALGCHTYMLDGDNVRHGLNKDLGFTIADRVENIRRVGEMARLFIDAGIIVLCSFISPFRAERSGVRGLVEPGEFLEIHVKAPLEVCEKRDPKGLYAKSRAGKLPNFTGIDSPYEEPEKPDLVLDTTAASAEELAHRVLALLADRALISPLPRDGH